jgi:uncharacterized membrane protein YeaQ/YmgE (transglycosylase-associated protein family)
MGTQISCSPQKIYENCLCNNKEKTMGILGWIIFGGLAGWVANIIIPTKGNNGCLFNVIIGVVGAFLGGLIVNFLGGDFGNFDWNWSSFGVAVLGSIILLAITSMARKK